MFRRIARHGALITVIVPAALFWLAGGCAGREVIVGDLDDASAPSLVAPDANEASTASSLVSYCPSDKCPAPWVTCPDSRFPCDVDIRSDVDNCGACGYRCPESGRGEAKFRCIDGTCVMSCGTEATSNIDCDGIPDNGCETKPTTNDNCGGCGIACTDPDKSCIYTSQGYRCGCPDGMIRCFDPNFGDLCFDPKTDDANCGGCGNACDPAGDGSEPPPNTRFGCVGGKCNQPKCEKTFGTYFLDCDGDITQPSSNGCETDAWSNESCGGCGNACPGGQECQGNEALSPTCSCPDGMTYCPYVCVGDLCVAGKCVDITVDKDNCGACGNACPRVNTNDPLSAPTCSYGTCGTECISGHADCNGNPADDCEVDTRVDPRNCGGCGIACDAKAGQACVGGRCVVEPCDVDGGPVR